jgi:hypothetical protein
MIFRKNIFLMVFLLLIALVGLNLYGCTQAPPRNTNNVCLIFKQYPDWYWAAAKVRQRWGIPVSVLMAIIHQESHFSAKAKPPREKLLWIIPWFRPTSAYGYSQAVNETWKRYKRDTGHTSMFTSRNAFGDAADFIGWFANQAHKRAGISKFDTYSLYLAYHEGIGGYMRGTYKNKAWLIAVAKKVQRRAWIYRSQLRVCETSLPKKPWYHVW